MYRCLREGWPKDVEEKLEPFSSKENEPSIHDGCVLCKSKIIPALHKGHPGMSKMKGLARMYVRAVAWY